jgi:hypothetical protein
VATTQPPTNPIPRLGLQWHATIVSAC